jgi:hypothetical protein
MNKKINIKVACACGDEVTEEDMSEFKEEIKVRLLYAIPNLVDNEDLERAAESIYDLMKPCPATLGRWRPSQGDMYFKIDSDGEIHKIIWNEDYLDSKFWAFGNCFKTEAEAYMARKQVRAALNHFHQCVQQERKTVH